MKFLLSTGLLLFITASFLLGFFFPLESKNIGNRQDDLADSHKPDFTSYTDIKLKKHDFFMYLLPKVRAANTEIKQQRQWLKAIDITAPLNSSQLTELTNLSSLYAVEAADINIQLQELLIRVNTIPASLVLAQAANESAWGTSRFALEGNNLFGQWCYVKGCGIVPKKRTHGESHEVAKFNTVYDSIKSYMRNLNSQFSYVDLRALRAKSAASGKQLSGKRLANGLLAYSTRREAYVREIQALIKINHLEKFD